MSRKFELLPWQEEVQKALNEGATHIYLKCGRKAGKTSFLRHFLIEGCKREAVVPEQINPFIAPTRIQGKHLIWRAMKGWVDKEDLDGKPNMTELVMDFKSGIRFQVFGGDNEEAARGFSFGDGVVDEADFVKPGFFEEVIEPNFAVTRRPVILSSTPKNGWFTKMWKDAKDGRLGRGHVAFRFTIYNNPTVDRGWIERTRRAKSEDVWKQEYMADESAFTGLQYMEFENRHVVGHKDPPMEGKFIRSLDWGFEHPSHCLWGHLWRSEETGRWNIYFYREMSVRGKSVPEIVTPILVSDKRSFIMNVIDLSAKRTEIGTGVSIVNEFRRHGYAGRLSQSDDAFNVNAAKVMLKSGDIQISDRCPILIRQLRSVEWGQQKGDDAADAFKYACGMVYNRDFTNIEPFFAGEASYKEEWIDPAGIIAARQQMEENDTWTYQ